MTMTLEEARQVCNRLVNERKTFVWLSEMMEQAEVAHTQLQEFGGKKSALEKDIAEMDHQKAALILAAQQAAAAIAEAEKIRLLATLQSLHDTIAATDLQLQEKKQQLVGQQARLTQVEEQRQAMLGQVQAERTKLVTAYEKDHQEKRTLLEQVEQQLATVRHQIATEEEKVTQAQQRLRETEKKTEKAKQDMIRIREQFQRLEV